MQTSGAKPISSVTETTRADIFPSLSEGRIVLVIGCAAMAVGLCLRLTVAWQDLEELVVKVLQDDSFYYFLTADRITQGQGISFDGVTDSNGYHPLWLFFLVPFYVILPGRDIPIHAALSAAAFLDVLAAGMVAVAVRRMTGNSAAALFALALYLFLPRNVLTSVNGLETSTVTFLLSALLVIVTYVWVEHPRRWIMWAVLTGVLAGLTILARLDSVVVVLCLFGVVAVLEPGSRSWRTPVISLSMAAGLVAPWFLWSYVATGSALPVSGESATWLAREHFYSWYPDADLIDQIRESWSYTRYVFTDRIPELHFGSNWLMTAGLVAVIGVIAHAAFLATHELRGKALKWLLVIGPPLAGFGALLLYHTAYRWFFREWYFAWGMPLMVMFAGLLFAYFCEAAKPALNQRPIRHAFGYGFLAGLMIVIAAGYIGDARRSWDPSFLDAQRDNLNAGLYLKHNTEPDARIASFNAGIVGYFSQRTVFNIDGVVNPDAFEALRDHELLAYLRSRNVEYVADRDQAWLASAAFITPHDWSESLWGEDPNTGMVRVAAIAPRFGFYGQMTVFRVAQ